jgi:hypothetical protein
VKDLTLIAHQNARCHAVKIHAASLHGDWVCALQCAALPSTMRAVPDDTRHFMKLRTIAPLALWTVAQLSIAATGDASCGVLSGAGVSAASGAAAESGTQAAKGFALRDGEPVDFIAGGKTVRGTLHVTMDGGVYRAYWQAQGRPERYVLANAGTDAVRLIAMPTQGTPAADGMPGTTLNPQQVLSCPSL